MMQLKRKIRTGLATTGLTAAGIRVGAGVELKLTMTRNMIYTPNGTRFFNVSSRKNINSQDDPQEGSSTDPYNERKGKKSDSEDSRPSTPSLMEDQDQDFYSTRFQSYRGLGNSFSHINAKAKNEILKFINNNRENISDNTLKELDKGINANTSAWDKYAISAVSVDRAVSCKSWWKMAQADHKFTSRVLDSLNKEKNLSSEDKDKLKTCNELNREGEVAIEKVRLAKVDILSFIRESKISDQLSNGPNSPDSSYSMSVSVAGSEQGSNVGSEQGVRVEPLRVEPLSLGLEGHPRVGSEQGSSVSSEQSSSVGSEQGSSVGSGQVEGQGRSDTETQPVTTNEYFPQDTSDILPGLDMPSHTDYED